MISSDFMPPNAGTIICGSDAPANVLLRVIVPWMCVHFQCANWFPLFRFCVGEGFSQFHHTVPVGVAIKQPHRQRVQFVRRVAPGVARGDVRFSVAIEIRHRHAVPQAGELGQAQASDEQQPGSFYEN